MTLNGLHRASAHGERNLGIRQGMEVEGMAPRAIIPGSALGRLSRMHYGKRVITNQINAAWNLIPDPVVGRSLGNRLFRMIINPDYHPVTVVIVGAIPVEDTRNVGGPGDRRVALGPSDVLNDRKCRISKRV